MAVGAEGGLVVPVLRDADRMSFAGIELAIRDFAARAGNGTLTLDDLKGGTFTITNGGVFGSLMSTPILNPPQVGILGLHKIADRAVAVNGAGGHPPDDVPGAQLRPPHRRRPRGRAVPGEDQGLHRRSRPGCWSRAEPSCSKITRPPQRIRPVEPPSATILLHAWRGGEATALDRLLPLVYDELARIARGALRSRARPTTRCRPARWCTRPTCASSTPTSRGRTRPTSWPWRRARCGACWSITRAAGGGRSAAAAR